MDQHVAQTEIAMRQRYQPVFGGDHRLKPLRQRDERGTATPGRAGKLPAPPAHLPLEIAARPAIVAQAHRVRSDRMKSRQGFRQRQIDRPALLGRQTGEAAVGEHPPLDELHQIERRTQQVGIVMVEHHRRHRHGAVAQGVQHPAFAVDGMGTAQNLAIGLLAQHHAAPVPANDIGGVRLASGNPLQLQSSRPQPIGEEARQPPRVEIRRAHAPAPATGHCQKSRPSAVSSRFSTMRCTSSAPSTNRAWRA